MSKKRFGILTGGGDVAPLNAVIASAKRTCEQLGHELTGIKYGWQGLLDGNTISLMQTDIDPQIGGTVLKSSRVNLSKVENGAARAEEGFNTLGLDGLIVIGGEDTLSNALYLKNLPLVLISKTIDNDVGLNNGADVVNYFTLGHPTAAEKISSFISLDEGMRSTAYSHERIIIVESMGMHAGWLALSSSMGNPDFLILPEFPVEYGDFLLRVRDKFISQKHVIVVMAEGARWGDGKWVSADSTEKDSFGHPRFRGAAETMAKRLKTDLKHWFDTRNVNSVNPSYLYRSGRPNKLDFETAGRMGERAVQSLQKGISRPEFLITALRNGAFEIESMEIQDVNSIEAIHRFVGEEFYDSANFRAKPQAIEYLSHIIKRRQEIKYGW